MSGSDCSIKPGGTAGRNDPVPAIVFGAGFYFAPEQKEKGGKNL